MDRGHLRTPNTGPESFGGRFLSGIEVIGNRLPDPVILFLLLLLATWITSALLAPIEFTETDPRTNAPVRIVNQLTFAALIAFMVRMVPTFTEFEPVGSVLVTLLGAGVAEKTGFINAGIQLILRRASRSLLTPMLILASIVSHSAAEAGYVLVIPLGGAIFYAAGRHPLAGISAAFAGVSGGFSAASFIPSDIDPLLQGITQQAAQMIDPDRLVNPLSNLAFTTVSSVLIIAVGWYLTDRVVEPRLQTTEVDGDLEVPQELSDSDRAGFWAGSVALAASLLLLALAALPAGSLLRDENGSLTGSTSPLMEMTVPLIFLLFVIPGVVHGYVAGTVKTHRDVIAGMTKGIGTMAYYLVMTFFAAQFIAALNNSNVGVLIALKGTNFLRELNLPSQLAVVGVVLVTAVVNLFVASAAAKWTLLSSIFVPMLMRLGISPELTQAAYRVGDSVTNIVTPLMPFFPLIVVFCRRYVKTASIGTLVSMMLPYSIVLLVTWTLLLIGYWLLCLPLGIQASYVYP